MILYLPYFPYYFPLPMTAVPELDALDAHTGSVRIPPEVDVPLTDRVRRIIDSEPFRKLAKITQVGLVSLVYPAARHTRFEHSLGVYRLALLFLKRLFHVPDFAEVVTPHDAERFIVTALLHDIGHYPFCHLIEDLRLGLPDHEALAARYLEQGELAGLLRTDWHIEPQEVIDLLIGNTRVRPHKKRTSAGQSQCDQILASILSGPIDIDKMDYLFRDSLHAGVPYGRNLDQDRLIGGLCLNAARTGLAITEKGKTAAELMVFARYVMFSEVYWHHTVRSATAMLQRLFRELFLQNKIRFDEFVQMTEDEAVCFFLEISKDTPLEKLAAGLFGTKRTIYKRAAQFSILEQPEMYRQLAGKPYGELCRRADKIDRYFTSGEHRSHVQDASDLSAFSVLIDAPPVKKEMEIKIDVYYPKQDRYAALEDISPVVRAMAREQFDDYAKRVRIFVHPDKCNAVRNDDVLNDILRSGTAAAE
ncbi:MAG: HD domain-containing protein [Planctomycetaceae bacterium]|jgi:HD superfamily phosphohydrolase|nr:HD domain-containing protein [Planctomycetaceae bacterium]